MVVTATTAVAPTKTSSESARVTVVSALSTSVSTTASAVSAAGSVRINGAGLFVLAVCALLMKA